MKRSVRSRRGIAHDFNAHLAVGLAKGHLARQGIEGTSDALEALGSGTGLGLAMACGIAPQTQGTITVESAPGRGTTFTVHLPASDA